MFAPGRCSPWEQGKCSDGDSGREPYTACYHQLLAHAETVRLYKGKYQAVQKRKIAITLVLAEFVRPKEDIELMASLGFRAYRFSISWPRIFPDGLGKKVNEQGVAFNNDLINFMVEKVNLQERSYFGELSGGIRFCSKLPTLRKQQPTYQELIIKHGNLKKLSLWGCSAIDALYVNCPELNDLNLNSCANLHPERLLLQCPNLKDVHVSGCRDMLIGAIRNQVLNEFAAAEPRLPCKRLADGSKRVQVPHFMLEQQFEDEKWGGSRRSQCTVHLK